MGVLLELALRQPRRVLALSGLVALAFLPGVGRLTSDNTPAVFFRAGTPAARAYAEFRARFGADEALRLVLRGPVLETAAGLDYLAALERGAAALPGVAAVAGVASAAPAWPPSADELRALRADPLWRELGVIAADGRVVSVLLALAPQGAARQAALLAAAEALVARPPPGLTAEVAGMASLNRALDEASRDVEWKYFPLLVLLAAGLLALAQRSLAGVALPLAFVMFSELAVFGAMGYAGVRLNMVLVVLGPLVLVIALATALYVQVRFHDARRAGAAPADAVREAYAAKRRPLVWTSVTTIVGFGALMLSELPPVRALGAWCVLATVVMLLAIFAAYPAWLRLVPGSAGARGERAAELGLQRLGGRLAAWGVRRRRWVIAGAALAGVAGLAGFPRLRVEGNALTYLPPAHPVRAAIEGLEREGVASASLELVLAAPDGAAGGFATGAAVGRLGFLAERLREIDGVLGVVGPGDLVAAALRRAGGAAGFGGGAALRSAALARLREAPQTAAALARFLTPDGGAARLTLFVRTVGLDALEPIERAASAIAAEELPAARATLTGEFPLLLDMQRGLLETLAASLLLTLVAVAGVFLNLLRSLRPMPLAVVTSLLPVVVVIGGMGWAGVPLDIATVMIASIVLGLAGDDTIHTVESYRALVVERGPRAAVIEALAQNAPAYVLTALVRVAGFGVCALSGFLPIHRFGALAALAIAVAAITDLVVVAALLGTERTAAGV